jgi:Uma2 family endonuclease
LLIEVASTTLTFDREEKAPIYATANILEYWILDIEKRQLYIYRNPTTSGYKTEIILKLNAALALLAFPEIEIPFSELFFS